MGRVKGSVDVDEKKEKKSYYKLRPGLNLELKPWRKAPSQRRLVDMFVVGDKVWITAIRKLSVLCNCVCRHWRIGCASDGKVVVIIHMEIQRTTCSPT